MLSNLIRHLTAVSKENLGEAILYLAIILALVFSVIRFMLQHENESIIRLLKFGLSAVFIVLAFIAYRRFKTQNG